MRTLIVGCGRSARIHYNPLYKPLANEELSGYAKQAINERRIVTESLCNHNSSDEVTIDYNEMRGPHFAASVHDTARLQEIERELGRQSFDRIILENFPFSVLVEEGGAQRFFHTCYYLLKVNGSIEIRTGKIEDIDIVNDITRMLNDAAFPLVQVLHSAAGFFTFYAPVDGRSFQDAPHH